MFIYCNISMLAIEDKVQFQITEILGTQKIKGAEA